MYVALVKRQSVLGSYALGKGASLFAAGEALASTADPSDKTVVFATRAKHVRSHAGTRKAATRSGAAQGGPIRKDDLDKLTHRGPVIPSVHLSLPVAPTRGC